MSEELFKKLLESGVGSQDIYYFTLAYHLGMDTVPEPWVEELDKYVKSRGDNYARYLEQVVAEFKVMKEEKEVGVCKQLEDEALRGVLSFGKTPMSGAFCRKFPDQSAYKVQVEGDHYRVVYKDYGGGCDEQIGKLFIAVDTLKQDPRECKTRGKDGSKFWWVNGDGVVRYYLFIARGFVSGDAIEGFNRHMKNMQKHNMSKKDVVRSYEDERRNSKVFS